MLTTLKYTICTTSFNIQKFCVLPTVQCPYVVTGRSQVSDLTTAGHHMRI